MKKNLFFALVISLVTFSSCLDTDYEPSPTEGGSRIWYEAKLHNNYVLFCAELAYKLNILLVERADSAISVEDIELVISKDGEDIKRENGLDYLFEDVNIKITDEGLGVWKLTFKEDANSNKYNGALLISTNEKLLNEPRASWRVQNAEGTGMEYDGGGLILSPFTGVTVTNRAADEFTIEAEEFGLYHLKNDPDKKYKSKWKLNFTVKKISAESDYSLLGMQGSKYEISGSSGGYPAGYSEELNLEFDYEIDDNEAAPSPLLYKYNKETGKMDLYGGTETVGCFQLFLTNPVDYPSPDVTVIWKESAAGIVYYELSYNGSVISSMPS